MGPRGAAIPRRIAFINEKGGSGKTTLVANVGAHLARNRRVLAIDMDPQGQLGKVLGLEVRRPRRTSIELLLDSVLGESSGRGASLDDTARGLPATPTRILVGTEHGGAYLTTDGGTTCAAWNLNSSPALPTNTVNTVAIFSGGNGGQTWAIGTALGLMVTTDDGATFTTYSTG